MNFKNIDLSLVHKLISMMGVKISKKTLGLIVVLAISLLIFLQAKSDNVELRADYYPVTQVFDGDTIEVDMAGNLETVRFIGIDTPETHHPDKGVQCYGQEATDRTKQLLEGKSVRLVADELGTNRDVYDRLLRYVYDEDGTLVNHLLIKEGYSFATSAFRYGLKDIFTASEAIARKQKVGLWVACVYSIVDGVPQTNTIDETISP